MIQLNILHIKFLKFSSKLQLTSQTFPFHTSALPHDYGNTWIKVGDEIQRNTYTKVNISDFFVGENWKIHPEWVYCRYHYLEGHEFQTPEQELREFLRKIVEKDWKWSQQYEPDPAADKKRDTSECEYWTTSFF